MTGSVVNTIAHLHRQAEQGKISHNEAKERARELVRAMRYGADGMEYFWVNDTDMHMVVHPYRPDLEGTDLSEFSDKEGKRIFRDFVEIATQFGGGFTDYHWQWKTSRKNRAQASYVRIPAWAGRGDRVYTDDVMKEIAGYRNQIAAIFLTILLAMAGLEIYVLRQTVITEKKKQKIEIQRERLVNALREGEERYRTIADFAYDWEMWIGTKGETVYCSPACERITGYPPERFFESPELVRSVILEEDRPAWDGFLEQAHSKDGDSLDFRIMTRNNQLRWVGAVGRGVSGIGMKPLGVRCSFRDITDSKGMEERLRHQALHDPLTGLATASSAWTASATPCTAQPPRQLFLRVVFLDLDRFKIITTPSATASATLYSWKPQAVFPKAFAHWTRSPVSVVTNSCCCSTNSPAPEKPSALSNAFAKNWQNRTPWTHRKCRQRQASASFSVRWTTSSRTTCCSIPTSPCTGPKRPDATASRFSPAGCSKMPWTS